MAEALAQQAVADKPQVNVEKWLQHISSYERTFERWCTRVDRIIKKYRDEQLAAESTPQARFNVLWSNVQTLTAATFARLPKPDVSRRFKDHDPVGRVASLLLERALDYEVDHYPDYRATMKASVLDRYLGGRATAWCRYDPKFKAAPTQVTEDVGPPPEQLDYECAPCDYVHWKDFGHVLARTWEEVPAVWRRVYMTRKALTERFGELGAEVPLDAKPEEYREENMQDKAELSRGCVYEIWDKETKSAIWVCKALREPLDARRDPLGLSCFFPCPKPMYATLANDKLIPTPDYVLYEHQAIELDLLCERIEGFIDALKVVGAYDASIDELKRLYRETVNTNIVPVVNWAAFAEKGKLAGAVVYADLSPIYEGLRESYLAMEQVKNQIYEITRISDIMRGYVNPREKLGQSELKSQYGNLGIKSYQEQVSEYATELLQIKAQIICNKFSPMTLLRISAADQLSDHDKQLIPQAMQLLFGERAMRPQEPAAEDSPPTNVLASFRIEIAADSLVHMDEEAEKESSLAFLQANGIFMKEAVGMLLTAGPLAAALAPLIMETWKFAVRAFKIGKSIEGAFDEALEKIKQVVANPQAQIPPEMVKQMEEQITQKVQTQVAMENATKQVTTAKQQADKELAFEKDINARELDLAKREAQFAIEKAEFSATRQLDAKAEQVAKQEESAIKQEKRAQEQDAIANENRTAALGDADGLLKTVTAAAQEAITRQMDGRKVVKVEEVNDKRGNLAQAVIHRADGSREAVKITVQVQ